MVTTDKDLICTECPVPFEPLYEYIKTDRNKVWFLYEDKIMNVVNWLSYQKNFHKDELLQQAFMYFCTLCEQYDPLYDGKFFRFDRYLFKNLIMKLRAYIQRYYFKGSREKVSEYCEIYNDCTVVNPIAQTSSAMYVDSLLALLPEKQKMVVSLTLQGYKQHEIGVQMNISQSRVSVIKKKAFKELQCLVDENFTSEQKRLLNLATLQSYYMSNHSTNASSLS